MAKHVWNLVALLCIISVKVSAYDRPSPTTEAPPQATTTPEPVPLGMKEIVLYLTPDQVESLKDAGARVRPYPGYEAEFAQQEEYQKHYRKKYGSQNVQNYQLLNLDQKSDRELEELFKAKLKIQQTHQNQAPEPSTEKPYASTPQYKNIQSRQQSKEYYMPYLPKKPTIAKSNIEYISWLPSVENSNIKLEPYQAQPLAPYLWNWEVKENAKTEPTLTALDILEAQKITKAEEPAAPVQIQGLAPVISRVLAPKLSAVSGIPQESYKVHEEDDQAQQKPKPALAQPPRISEDKLKALLAPLLSHQNVVEKIAEQKEELINNEQEIQTKLREIKESPTHDHKKYTDEVDKLELNLGKQNALSEIEALAKSPASEKDGEQLRKKRPPMAIVRNEALIPSATIVPITYPIEVKLPKPYILPLETPLPTEQTAVEKALSSLEVPQHAPVSLTKNVFVNIDNPYVIQKVDPIELEVPELKPEKLTIIRHLWNH